MFRLTETTVTAATVYGTSLWRQPAAPQSPLRLPVSERGQPDALQRRQGPGPARFFYNKFNKFLFKILLQ
jgi:hypothetical protein